MLLLIMNFLDETWSCQQFMPRWLDIKIWNYPDPYIGTSSVSSDGRSGLKKHFEFQLSLFFETLDRQLPDVNAILPGTLWTSLSSWILTIPRGRCAFPLHPTSPLVESRFPNVAIFPYTFCYFPVVLSSTMVNHKVHMELEEGGRDETKHQRTRLFPIPHTFLLLVMLCI